jgi:hypothetical protein
MQSNPTLGGFLDVSFAGNNILDGLGNSGPVAESNKWDLLVLAVGDKIWPQSVSIISLIVSRCPRWLTLVGLGEE